jgi:serine/threonine protein phosphatase PrpC
MTVPHTQADAPASPASASPATAPARKPRDDEIDVYGLTHPGKVRTENQDHFLICTLRKQMVVMQSSLAGSSLVADGQRLALLMMVADGVGGGARGEEASRLALEAVSQYVSRSMGCFYAAGAADDSELAASLETVAAQCHAELLRRGEANPELRGMATTLTLYLGVWPRAFLLQVGDSRCYLLRDGELSQITRDQTMAQELMDLGVLKPADAATGKLAHTLSSSIGGRQTAPVISRVDLAWGTVLLLCSDGLTRHVSDDRIREHLRAMTSARQVCEALVAEALEGGGSDNITVIVRRAVMREG